ncbi:CarD family transcriptional regulator, partial [Mammaliicoccus sciuri]|uniref:CarD family transcriptional regulator n=1 Tax=Mammaliicoccus sciuri TaxID=1296 RepID=UPI0023B78313
MNSNINTHKFIDAQYWHNNYEDVLNAFKEAEIVVHVHHGVGKYLGVETLEVSGIHKDYIK